jgi:predicted nucleic acid-binding protein
MTTWVIDASVVVKWALPVNDRESHHEQALTLLQDIQEGHTRVLQPPHWLAEVGAVLTRLAPDQARDMLYAFLAMELPISTEWEVYEQACRLAVNLNHHLFDTLYHAVALQFPDSIFITADTQYFRKAAQLGCIIELKDFSV